MLQDQQFAHTEHILRYSILYYMSCIYKLLVL